MSPPHVFLGTWNHHQLKPVVHECEVVSIAGILSRQGVVTVSFTLLC